MQRLRVPASLDHLEEAMTFIEDWLKKYKVSSKTAIHTRLVAEEWIVRLIEAAHENAMLHVSVRLYYGVPRIKLSVPGTKIEEEERPVDLINEDAIGEDSVRLIRSVLLQAHKDQVVYKRADEMNYVKISAGSRSHIVLFRNIMSFLVAMILGHLLYQILPRDVAYNISDNFLVPLQSIFLNAIQMVAAPAIFFALTTNICRFMSFSFSGKTTARILFSYFATSFLAVFVSLGIVRLINPEQIALSGALSDLFVPTHTEEISVLDRMFGIIPDNILEPFSTTNALQLLILAIFGGIALQRAGKHSTMLKDIADALDKFFMAIVDIISSLMPVAIFFSTILMMLYFDLESLSTTMTILVLTALGLIAMVVLYLLTILCAGRLNPLPFIKKCKPDILDFFLGGSTITAIPRMMDCCTKKLGIHKKTVSFSIPFGAIANMDGNCVYLTIVGLLLARIYGVNLFGSNLVTTVLTIVLLSITSSITPGSALLVISMLLAQAGIPSVVMCLILGINALLEMMLAVCNCLSDMALTLVSAKNTDMLDKEIYFSK